MTYDGFRRIARIYHTDFEAHRIFRLDRTPMGTAIDWRPTSESSWFMALSGESKAVTIRIIGAIVRTEANNAIANVPAFTVAAVDPQGYAVSRDVLRKLSDNSTGEN